MKKIVLLVLFIIFMHANSCNKKLFSLHIINPINFKFLLNDLVNECELNIIIKDKKAKQLINQNIEFINVNNVSLKEFLDVLFKQANLFYELKNNNLIISYYKTKTFELNFIPNSISGTAEISDNNIDQSINTLTANYKFDFWDNLKDSIEQLLENSDEAPKKPIIDKNSGLITVTGTKNQIEEIKKYIDSLNNRLHKEVLIDVKIYTVELSKSHQTGIKWSELALSLPSKNIEIKPYNLYEYIGGSYSIFSGATFNIGAFLNFLAKNGNVNTISNPKIVTLNNQKAIIRVGDTIYYRYVSSEEEDENGKPITKYTIENKFVGVLLDITPQISDNGEIVLSINPKISTFKNPNQLLNSNRNMPPDIKENTLMSVVKLRNNDILILGGLITNEDSLEVNGVPILKEIPLIKYLFSSKEKVTNKKELVFVITPRIIDLNEKKTLKDYGFGKLPTLEELNVR